MNIFSLTLDIIICITLIGSIFYIFQVNKKLIFFQSSKKEMKHFVNSFDLIIDKAKKLLNDLNITAQEGCQDIEKKIQQSHKLQKKIELLNEEAKILADRLEKTTLGANKISKNLKANLNQAQDKTTLMFEKEEFEKIQSQDEKRNLSNVFLKKEVPSLDPQDLERKKLTTKEEIIERLKQMK